MARGRNAPPDDDEFAAFVQARWPALYRSAVMLLGDRHLAEDLVQTALASTYANWHRIERAESAPAYARRTLHNSAFAWMRKHGWRNELPTEELPHTARGTTPQGPDLSLRPTVLEALAQLAPRQRAVLVLRYYDDLSVSDTARTLDITEGTVKSQTSHGLARLRTLLGDDEITHLRAV